MKIIAISDIHLDANTAGVDRYNDMKRSVESAVARAKTWPADLFVFAGDASDPDSGPRTIRAIQTLVAAACALRDAQIPSIWVAGNHDVIEDGKGGSVLSPLKAIDNVLVQVVDEAPRSFGTVGMTEIIALPYPSLVNKYDPAAFVAALAGRSYHPPGMLFISHLTQVPDAREGEETFEMPRGRGVRLPIEEIAKYDPLLVLQGHYHYPQRIRYASGLAVDVIGAPEKYKFGESGHRAMFYERELHGS